MGNHGPDFEIDVNEDVSQIKRRTAILDHNTSVSKDLLPQLLGHPPVRSDPRSRQIKVQTTSNPASIRFSAALVASGAQGKRCLHHISTAHRVTRRNKIYAFYDLAVFN